MARPWRIEYGGAYYHVLSRGKERRDIFLDDRDRRLFLSTLGETSDRFRVEIFAYVLMGNHYHLLLRTNLPNLSRAMQGLCLTYARRLPPCSRVSAAIGIGAYGEKTEKWKTALRLCNI